MDKKIFLAETSPLIAKKISAVLENSGFEVEIFEDGLECASKALKCTPLCIVCDISLKTVNGVQLCSVIKNAGFSYFPFILF